MAKEGSGDRREEDTKAAVEKGDVRINWRVGSIGSILGVNKDDVWIAEGRE